MRAHSRENIEQTELAQQTRAGQEEKTREEMRTREWSIERVGVQESSREVGREEQEGGREGVAAIK